MRRNKISEELAEEQLIRSYFLGDLSESEQNRLQERLFTDQSFFETVLMIEGELVDEYVLGLLSDGERAKLENGLLTSPHAYRKVDLVKTLDQYIADLKERTGISLQSFTKDRIFARLLSTYFKRDPFVRLGI